MTRQVIGTRGESITATLLNGHSFKLTPNDLLLYWYISAYLNAIREVSSVASD